MIAAEADRRPGVVAEDQEARAEGPDLDQRHAVEDRRHRVLADAEVEVPAAVVARPRSRRRPRRSSWVLVEGARSAEPPISQGTFLAMALSTLPDESRLAIPLGSAGKVGQVLVPAVGELAVLHPVELVGQVGVLASCSSATLANQASRSCLAALADARP